jgi:hypothetical protein
MKIKSLIISAILISLTACGKSPSAQTGADATLLASLHSEVGIATAEAESSVGATEQDDDEILQNFIARLEAQLIRLQDSDKLPAEVKEKAIGHLSSYIERLKTDPELQKQAIERITNRGGGKKACENIEKLLGRESLPGDLRQRLEKVQEQRCK